VLVDLDPEEEWSGAPEVTGWLLLVSENGSINLSDDVDAVLWRWDGDHTQLVNDAPGAIMDEAKKRWEHLRKMRKRTEGA
jgi:hypothetical protein